MAEERYVKDGKVAVLYSPEYGAGWSTWGNLPVFDANIVRILLDESLSRSEQNQKIEKYCESAYPDEYLGGVENLRIKWLPIGTHFIFLEDDGYESIMVRDAMAWIVA
jgi:hypothetical protein